MLTKSDLSQIRGAVRDEVDSVVENRLEPIKKDMKSLKEDVRYIKKTADLIGKNYDRGDVELGKRVSKIEDHLGFPDNN